MIRILRPPVLLYGILFLFSFTFFQCDQLDSDNPLSFEEEVEEQLNREESEDSTELIDSVAVIEHSKEIPISPYADGEKSAVGVSGTEDGSESRLALYGEDEYFWGTVEGDDIPLVKISHAESPSVTDIKIHFNPYFVDLTYGENGIGWGNRHFNHIVTSDHVELAFTNGDGDTVMHCKLDLLSKTSLTESGYASLGVTGGDGELIQGSLEDILSFGTSMDDNMNVYGYNNLSTSPASDSIFSPNGDSPYYEFNVIYRISLDPTAFGASGYGETHMTYVHASPSKLNEETIYVDKKPKPVPSQNPFVFTNTNLKTYTDTDTIDTTPLPLPTDTATQDSVVLVD